MHHRIHSSCFLSFLLANRSSTCNYVVVIFVEVSLLSCSLTHPMTVSCVQVEMLSLDKICLSQHMS
jgi:hypothetical protein